MKTTSLNTLAAGMLTCVCVAGIAESASAQFFSNGVVGSTDSRVPISQYNGASGIQQPLQWQDRDRMDRRDFPTHNSDGPRPQDDYRSRQGRCPDGRCQHKDNERMSQGGTTSYRGRGFRGSELADGRGVPSLRVMTTDWDPAKPEGHDRATGLPMERSHRGGHDHANRQHDHGHGRGRDCLNGQCGGQDGQWRQQRSTPQNAHVGYGDFNLTRGNSTGSQSLPIRNPYLN